MLITQVPRTSRVIEKIRDFYISIYKQRLYSNAKVKYLHSKAEKNIKDTLAFIGMQFDDTALKETILLRWKALGLYEIKYKKWHLGVTVQLDLFGNNIAIVQDCCHDKDYHNDTMETEPFKMDNLDDKSHLVDWKEYRMKNIIRETINQYLKRNLIKYK